ncbi:hypothetical protein P3S68_033476 [Capsicum galapagoense]
MQYSYLFSVYLPLMVGFLLIAIGARLEETSPILVLVALPTVVLLCREMLQPPDRRKTFVLNCLCFLCGFVLQFLMVGVLSSSMLKHVGIDFRFVPLIADGVASCFLCFSIFVFLRPRMFFLWSSAVSMTMLLLLFLFVAAIQNLHINFPLSSIWTVYLRFWLFCLMCGIINGRVFFLDCCLYLLTFGLLLFRPFIVIHAFDELFPFFSTWKAEVILTYNLIYILLYTQDLLYNQEVQGFVFDNGNFYSWRCDFIGFFTGYVTIPFHLVELCVVRESGD